MSKKRFTLDTDSGFVYDAETEQWLTTAEEVYDAINAELQKWKKEARFFKKRCKDLHRSWE